MSMMNLIPCDADYKHQSEGYCCLDKASQVTNAEGGCAYYEGNKRKKDSSDHENNNSTQGY